MMATTIEYPRTFPRPIALTLEPAERRAMNIVGPMSVRARQRDFLARVSVDFPPMTPEQVESFYSWWNITLDSGGRWFVAWDWPRLQGFTDAVYRFLGVPKFTHIAKGVQSVKAQFQVRGRGDTPQLQTLLPEAANCFTEQFEDGMVPYTVLSGTPLMEIVSTEYGNALQLNAHSVGTVQRIQRVLPETILAASFKGKFKVVDDHNDDAGVVTFLNNGVFVLAINVRREVSYDSQRRLRVYAPGEQVIGSVGVVIGDWYEFEVQFVEGAGNSAVIIRHLPDNALFSSAVLTGNHPPALVNQIQFNTDAGIPGSFTMSTTQFTGVEVCTDAETDVGQIVDVSASANSGTTPANGVTVNGFLPTDVLLLSLPTGQLYDGWSAWPADDSTSPGTPPPPGQYWGNGFLVTSGVTAVGTFGTSTGYPNGEAARAAFAPVQISGFSTYTFWISDENPGDNRGGVSIKIVRIPAPLEPPSMLVPRVVGLDYTQDYSTPADDARYGLVIRGFTINQANVNGATYGAALLAANPNTALAQYVCLNELKDPVSSGEDLYPVWQEVNARNWWVYSEPTHIKVQWTSGYGNYEVNFTAYAPTNPSGQRYPQFKAAWDFSARIDNIPDATWLFCDNVWKRARVTADYNRDGANETPAMSESYFTAGHIAYAAALRAQRPGLKLVANANNDLSGAFSSVYDAAFNEGCIGKSYGTFTTGGINAVRTRTLAHINNTLEGMAILNAYGASTDYKTFRFALTMAMMFDAWLCPVDETGGLHPVWMDEFEQEIGARTDPIPSEATENGIWACRFENGVVFCNPTNSAATINTAPFGSLTRFLGTQAPSVNSGAPVSGTITIPAKDGLLLLNA